MIASTSGFSRSRRPWTSPTAQTMVPLGTQGVAGGATTLALRLNSVEIMLQCNRKEAVAHIQSYRNDNGSLIWTYVRKRARIQLNLRTRLQNQRSPAHSPRGVRCPSNNPLHVVAARTT